MKHYFRTVFHYPNGEIEISDNQYNNRQDAIYEGWESVEAYPAGVETLKLAGEDYHEGGLRFEVEECWEDDDVEIERIVSEMF